MNSIWFYQEILRQPRLFFLFLFLSIPFYHLFGTNKNIELNDAKKIEILMSSMWKKEASNHFYHIYSLMFVFSI